MDMLTSYEWDLETDGQYSDSYESTARYTHYYDPEDLGLGIDVLKQIVDSRDFRIELRKQFWKHQEPSRILNIT